MSDKRIEKTKILIKKTFLELARTTELNKISVKAICDYANINRGTFYYHYLDVIDLQEKLEVSAANRIAKAILDSYHFNGQTSDLIDNLFLCLKDYPEDAWLLFGEKKNNGQEKGLEYLYNKLKEVSLPQWREKSHVNNEQLDIIFNHTMHSIFHLLKLWQNNKTNMTEKEFKEIYTNVILHGIYSYIYK